MWKIRKRYEYMTREGMKWTTWFTVKAYNTQEEAKENLKTLKTDASEIAKKVKRKFEMIIEES